MTATTGVWSPTRIASIAPDDRVAAAGLKLSATGAWTGLGRSENLLWGQYRSSGGTTCQVHADLSEPAFRCSCSSEKFPCKHVIGLLHLWRDGRVDEEEPTNVVRTQQGENGTGGTDEAAAGTASAVAGAASVTGATDTTGAAARDDGAPADSDQRPAFARISAHREQSITNGLSELDHWLSERVEQGITTADDGLPAALRRLAARMVDAQAPALAPRLADLAALAHSAQSAKPDRPAQPPPAADPRRATAGMAAENNGHDSPPPAWPAGINRYYLPNETSGGMTHSYPIALASVRLYYRDAKSNTRHEQTLLLQAPFGDSAPDWAQNQPAPVSTEQLQSAPHQPCQHHPVPAAALDPAAWKNWEKTLATHLRQHQSVVLYHAKTLDAYSNPGEDEASFRNRLATAAHEKRDAAITALRMKYAKQHTALAKQQQTAQAAVEREKSQSNQSLLQTGLAIGGALLSAFTGRKALSATTIAKTQTAIKSASKIQKERQDIAAANARETLVAEQIAQMEAALAQELQTLREQYDPATLPLEEKHIDVKASDITIERLALGYVPLG